MPEVEEIMFEHAAFDSTLKIVNGATYETFCFFDFGNFSAS